MSAYLRLSSAGAVSFIKIKTITAIGAVDIVDTVELVIWGAAESAVTIMAASIPVLRALFRDYKPPPARFVSDEESMLRRLGAGSVRTATAGPAPAVGRSRSDVELIEVPDKEGAQDHEEKNQLALQAWEARDVKPHSRKDIGNGATLSSHFDAFGGVGPDVLPPRRTHMRNFSRKINVDSF